MSTINTHFTLNYSQPEAYRLSHDSVFLAREVYEKTMGLDLSNKVILDLCAGSGVVGLDFLFHRRAQLLTLPLQVDFLEIQKLYFEHFQENCKRFGHVSSKLDFLNCNYDELQTMPNQNRYDLILGNPPYFLISQGRLSLNEFKNRCRFYMDSDIKNLILSVQNSLKPNGKAFLLFRDQISYKIDIEQSLKNYCEEHLSCEIVGNIRGTLLFQFQKNDKKS